MISSVFDSRSSEGKWSGKSPETMQKLCLSKKFTHLEIRWDYDISRIDWVYFLRKCPKFLNIGLGFSWMNSEILKNIAKKIIEICLRRQQNLIIFWHFSSFENFHLKRMYPRITIGEHFRADLVCETAK